MDSKVIYPESVVTTEIYMLIVVKMHSHVCYCFSKCILVSAHYSISVQLQYSIWTTGTNLTKLNCRLYVAIYCSVYLICCGSIMKNVNKSYIKT